MSGKRGRTRTRRRTESASWWRGPWPIAGSLLAIVVIIIGFVLVSRLSPAAQPAPSADSTVIAEVTHVDQSVIEAVGTGGLANPLQRTGGGTPLSGPSGKPEILYLGAEWCPYCAAERWSLAVALSRFGEFQGLGLTSSSSTDVFPDTPTLSFAHISFQSDVVEFVAVELADRQRQPLASPTPQETHLMQTYDPQRFIPFVDVGNQYIAISSGYQPSVVAGLNWKQIADALRDPTSPVTRGIVGNANYLTAAICQLTSHRPAAACGSPAVQQIAAQLGK
jgi:thiol-disulfide isomerase/thioredoxin